MILAHRRFSFQSSLLSHKHQAIKIRRPPLCIFPALILVHLDAKGAKHPRAAQATPLATALRAPHPHSMRSHAFSQLSSRTPSVCFLPSDIFIHEQQTVHIPFPLFQTLPKRLGISPPITANPGISFNKTNSPDI
ncbi:uncharacterized protein MYCFIDRAFT_172711 [Pseudocercospora fijiensis CIRAD86]|uniref:Uncharacterized protein n=1 Tax=Pseudocercospora fijiensis (strain CIRAD86) TaxID=383855 RepID=M3BCY8_PSEFD|nr:uncharacterized protein MYCFIDRAFT_172711 [Pseudocercospora fijiensis CIRAD86]EME87033.1 hypothetical protein MYCFIDRAFT_172711 [Pseudocercospora fijiensis CIRAD86]